MAYKSISVEITQEHFERSIKGSPREAIKELIWNACDADAQSIEVTFGYAGLPGAETVSDIYVKDDGHGIPVDCIEEYFGKYGLSRKSVAEKSPAGRIYHGKLGQGRYKAMAAGNFVDWLSVFRDEDGNLYSSEVHINSGSRMDIRYSETAGKTDAEHTGTTVHIHGIADDKIGAISKIADPMEMMPDLLTTFAPYLLAYTDILGRGGSRLTFSRVEPLSGTKFLQAEAETKEDTPRRAVICFAGETKPLDSRMVAMALDEAETLRPAPKLIIFAAFQFDLEAAKDIDEMNWPGVTILKAQMNTDLMTEDLKKKRSSDQSFWLVGQPDVELIRDGRSKRKFKVKVNGFDYYDVKKGTVESGSTSRIAMWMLDTDYDGMCIEPKQVFFPMGGKKDGWNKLAKTLRAEIDPDLIEKYAGNESLWFIAEPNTRIAVKIIDDRGIESLKVIRIGDE